MTKIAGPNGEEIYIVGTAHFSTVSMDDVKRTIELVQPDIICLELCESRSDFMEKKNYVQ